MRDEDKSKEELIQELRELRQRNSLLESSEQECRRGEEALELEVTRLLSVYDNVDELIYVSDPRTYEVLYVNSFGKKLLAQDPLGHFCFNVFEGLDSPCTFCPNEKILKLTDGAFRWERKNPILGRYFRLTDRIIRWPDGRDVKLEVTTDITELKKTEAVLRESEERYRLLTQNSLTGIYIHKDGVFLFVNDRLAEMHDCTPDQMIGKSVLDFVHPDDRQLVRDTYQSAETEGTVVPQYVFRALSSEGNIKWLNILATTVKFGDEVANMGNVEDITDRKAMEEELLNKIRTIDELYEHVVQTRQVKAIAEHTANVAHELRQPLAIIGGFARRLERHCVVCEKCDKSDDSNQHDSFQVVINEVNRLEQILGALIDFTRRESVSTQAVNPHDLINYVLDIHRGRLNEKSLRIERALGDQVREVPLDQAKFQQVVRNLLANAIEASPQNETIRLETGLSMPSNRARKTGRLDSTVYFEMKIQNQGEAIPQEEFEKIFNPFYTTKDYAGGLGLTLSRKIIQDHGGSISVKSDPKGTAFTVWLPVTEPMAAAGSVS
jgi:PAS domain S-box-containing protein